MKEVWTGKRWNLEYLRIFNRLVFLDISLEKQFKLAFCKVWMKILIEYNNDTIKHFYVCTFRTSQVIIVSKPYINKLK